MLLGIDGGNSKTRALLADRSGAVLGAGTAGSSNHNSVGFEAATQALQTAIGEAFQRAAIDLATPIDVACLGLAGADRPADRARLDAWITRQGIARRWMVVTDAELVLVAGNPTGWGVALICGTGSICYGRTHDGRSTRAGGWGYLLGDEGSGYDIALRALRLATRTADGCAAAPTILQAALDHWGLEEPFQLIGHVYRDEMTRAELATLAQRIALMADMGDHAAAALLDQAAQDMARLVGAVVRKLDLCRPPIMLAGGLFNTSARLRHAVVAHTEVELGPPVYVDEPALGALTLARQLWDGAG